MHALQSVPVDKENQNELRGWRFYILQVNQPQTMVEFPTCNWGIVAVGSHFQNFCQELAQCDLFETEFAAELAFPAVAPSCC